MPKNKLSYKKIFCFINKFDNIKLRQNKKRKVYKPEEVKMKRITKGISVVLSILLIFSTFAASNPVIAADLVAS